MDTTVVTLKCAGCKHHKPVSEFGKASNRVTGYQAYCKECMKKHGVEIRQKREADLEALKQQVEELQKQLKSKDKELAAKDREIAKQNQELLQLYRKIAK